MNETKTLMHHRPTFLDFFLLVFISFVWGSSFSAIKIGLKTFDPFSLAASRVIVAGLFLYLVSRLRGEKFPTDRENLKNLAVMGAFGSSAFILISWAQQFVSSSMAAIVLGFGPLNLLFLAHLLTEDEKMTAPKLLGVLFGLAGVFLLFGNVDFSSLGGEAFGLIALFTASVSYAFCMIWVRRLAGVSSINVSAGFLLMAAFIAFPLSVLFDPIWSHQFTVEGTLAILFLGLASTGISGLLMIVLIKRAGTTFTSYSNYITPMVAILWGVVLFGEPMTLRTWAALGLILGGVALGTLWKGKKSLP